MRYLLLNVLLIISLNTQSQVITKNDIINEVKHHFPEILIQQEKIIQTKEQTRSYRGAFDPSLEGAFNSEPVGGYENNYYEASLDYPIENTGNSINAGYKLGRGDWPVYYQNYLTNSYGDTYIGINIPLVRNRLIDKARQNILSNELLTQSERFMLEIKENEAITSALDVYYECLKAVKHLKIASKLLSIAKVRQKAIAKQINLGDIARMNEIENNRLIMQRRSVVVAAQQKLISEKNKLLFYVGFNSKTASIIKSGSFDDKSISTLSKGAINKPKIDKVHQFQPYLKFLNTKIKQGQLAIYQSKNEMKPKLDLSVFLDKQHGNGNAKLGETSINLGLKYKVPLRLRKAQGELAKNQSLIRSYQIQKKLFIRQMSLTYQNLHVDINAMMKLYKLRKKEIDFAKELEKAERVKFKAGDSSLFLVNQREQTVASTQFLVVDALISYHQRLNFLESLCFYKRQCFK